MSDAMTAYSALLACALPEEARARLSRRLALTVLADAERPDPSSVPAAAAEKDPLVVSVTLPMTADLVVKLPPSIRAIGTYSVGYDHVDLQACRERGLKVYNTPDVLTDAVAGIAMLLLLGAARRVKESSALIAELRWTGCQPSQLNGIELAGKNLGIFGIGRIGGAVAVRARAFGMTIHYSNGRRLPPELECGSTFHPHVRYRALDNVFLLPHIGSSTIETRARMAESLPPDWLPDFRGRMRQTGSREEGGSGQARYGADG